MSSDSLKTKILNRSRESIKICADALKSGQVVGIPTETVYGLAGNAFNSDALSKIFKTKERPQFDPLIVHIAPMEVSLAEILKEDVIDISQLSTKALQRIQILIQNFWPGPLTLVLPKSKRIPDLATSGLKTVALRMPLHPDTLELIRECGFPLCAPSANRFGRISPTTAQAVYQELGNRMDWILDGGSCEIGIESTIVQVSLEGELTLLRAGGLPIEKLESITKAKIHTLKAQTSSSTGFVAPGMMSSHYAPLKPSYYLNEDFDEDLKAHEWVLRNKFKSVSILKFFGSPETEKALALGALSRIRTDIQLGQLEILSEKHSIDEAAKNLFSKLRMLDELDSDAILIEKCPELSGLGLAIHDRLMRATYLSK